MFTTVDPKQSLPEIEQKQLAYWKKNHIFDRSVKAREGQKKFVFFDGPPFANGLPHYGHILANSLKDAVTRYFTMRGFHTPRVNGWDCHGLPVEYEIEKKLELGGRKDIEEMGVENFNNKCRESVFTYTQQWEELLERIGRWVDTENGYATLNTNYMESIWWVFKQIWDKGLIYQGRRSMHICPRCVTSLSNFEVSQGYQDVTDLSVVAKFQSKKDPNTYFLAWTTTPWTLPGNAALAVGKDIDYVKVTQDGQSYILAKELVEKHFELDGLIIEEEFKGKDLIGHRYEPVFDTYLNSKEEGIEKAWQVLAADFVSTESGTGIVHIAGGYGEDDMNLVLKHGLPIFQHVAMDGTFKAEVTEFASKFVKGQDHNIADFLEQKGLLFKKENYRHSYPHCWRCDTPLLNFATEAWYIEVTKIKEQLIENNKKIHWQPSHIQEGRFGKWLENVRDWNVSRNRFWGCPLPIWNCEDCNEFVCIGSLEELQERGGELPKRDGKIDLHKPYIDDVKLKCPSCKQQISRIPEVLDCWFESGSMPYAQLHYPFENKNEFEKNFPAQFIAEGLDQTRGWFYTLHVLSTILFGKPAFQNVIVNGILLSAEGEKLSKRKKNYPDPTELFNTKGVDTTRLFLYSSTAPQAQDVRFSEQHVDDLLKKFTLTLWNSYSFFVTYANIDGFKPKKAYHSRPSHKLDQWILSELNQLTETMTQEMEAYNLTQATRPLIEFVDQLSNWYVRRSRRRFWKSENDTDKEEAYQTLWTVLVQLSQLMAPFMPFLSDEIYQNLTGEDSVHLSDWPEVKKDWIDPDLNQEIETARVIVNLGHAIRAKAKIKVRQPLSELRLGLPESVSAEVIHLQEDVLLEELNVKILKILKDPGEIAEYSAMPDAKKLGPKYGKAVQKIIQDVKAGHFELLETGQVQVGEFTLEPDEIELGFVGKDGALVESKDGLVVSLDIELSQELVFEGIARDVIRHTQDLRKEAGYKVSDRIYLIILSEAENEDAVTHFADLIKTETLAEELQQGGELESDLEKSFEINGKQVRIGVKHAKS